MRSYWLRIFLGAFAIFAIGMIGVTFARASQGRGYATEALTALLSTLFDEHGIERVHAECHRRNDAVHALLERVGLRRDADQADPDWCIYVMRRP